MAEDQGAVGDRLVALGSNPGSSLKRLFRRSCHVIASGDYLSRLVYLVNTFGFKTKLFNTQLTKQFKSVEELQ